MIEITRSALLPYSAESLFELVSDIRAYPDYIPNCIGAKIIREWDQGLEAQLTVSALGVKYPFSTRNTVQRPSLITMELSEGPLKHLKGSWLFKSLSDSAAKIELQLQFEADGAIKKVAAKQLVERTSTSVVDALIKRAHAVLGAK